jgi:chromosome segregation ATPase
MSRHHQQTENQLTRALELTHDADKEVARLRGRIHALTEEARDNVHQEHQRTERLASLEIELDAKRAEAETLAHQLKSKKDLEASRDAMRADKEQAERDLLQMRDKLKAQDREHQDELKELERKHASDLNQREMQRKQEVAEVVGSGSTSNRELKGRITMLEKDVTVETGKMHTLERDKASLSKARDDLNAKLAAMEKKAGESDRAAARLRTQLSDMEKRCAEAQNKLDGKNAEHEGCAEVVYGLKEQIKELQGRQETVKTMHQQHILKMKDDWEREKTGIAAKCEREKEAVSAGHQKKLEDMETERVAREATVAQLKSALAEANRVSGEDKRAAKKREEALKAEVEKMTEQAEQMKKENLREREDGGKKQRALKSEVDTLKLTVTALEADKKHLLATVDTLKKELAESATKLKSRTAELSACSDGRKQAVEQRDACYVQRDAYQSEHATLRSSLEDCRASSEKGRLSAQAKLKSSAQAHDQAMTEKEEALAREQEHVRAKKDLERRLAVAMQQNDECKRRREDAEGRVDTQREEIDRLHKDVSQRDTTVATLNLDKSRRANGKARCDDQAANQTAINDLERRNANMAKELRALHTAMERLQK